MSMDSESPGRRETAQAIQIRDQLWADLRTALPELDRLTCALIELAHKAEHAQSLHVRLELTTADTALIAQVLAMVQGELHLRDEGLVV